MATRQECPDAGFTLIELLVVIAIIGILASVALAQYATYKEKAVDADMQSALHAARNGMEAYYVANGTYSGATEDVLKSSFGYRASTNVTLNIVPPPTDSTYGLLVCESGGTTPAYAFSFTGGSGVEQAVSGPCT